MAYCNYCDPKFFVIYGYCGNCKRKCEPPLFDPRNMSILDYEKFRRDWNQGRADLVLDMMRKTV